MKKSKTRLRRTLQTATTFEKMTTRWTLQTTTTSKRTMIRAAIILNLTRIVQYNGSLNALYTIGKIANHGSIQTRNRQERKRPTKASSITAQTNASIIALRNGLSNTLLSARKEVIKI